MRRLICLLTVALAACAGTTGGDHSAQFDPRPFGAFQGNALLCFDFRDDDGVPDAGLVLRFGNDAVTERRNIVLPFPTSMTTPNRGLLLASGSYESFTILSVSVGSSALGVPVVAFRPESRKLSTRPLVEGLEPGLYFHEDGLERWFVFIDSSRAVQQTLQKEFPTTRLESFDSVAVAIPSRAEGRDVRKGRSVYPEPDIRSANVMLFGSDGLEKSGRRVELRYEVPATAAQMAASSTGFKLVLVLIVPIVTLIFLDSAEINRPLLRLRAVQVGIAIQIVVTIAVLYAAFAIRRPEASVIGDFVVGATAVLCEIVVLLVKAKPRRPPKRA